MGILYMNTADVGDTSRFAGVQGTVDVVSTTARTGTRSFRLAGSRGVSTTAPATGYVKWGWMADEVKAIDWRFYLKSGSSSAQLTVTHNTFGGVASVWRGAENTTLLFSASGISMNTWYLYELYYVIHDTSGVATLRLNGVQVGTFSGDTRASGSADVDTVQWYSNASYMYLDDIVIRDDTWPGVGGVHVQVPNAAGDLSAWTPSAGNDYDCVNDVPADFTDYLKTNASVVNTKHLLNLANLPRAADSVAGVAVCARAQLDAVGAGTMRTTMKYNGVTANGPTVGLSSSPLWVDYYRTTDPEDNAWTSTSVDGLQAGIETI